MLKSFLFFLFLMFPICFFSQEVTREERKSEIQKEQNVKVDTLKIKLPFVMVKNKLILFNSKFLFLKEKEKSLLENLPIKNVQFSKNGLSYFITPHWAVTGNAGYNYRKTIEYRENEFGAGIGISLFF